MAENFNTYNELWDDFLMSSGLDTRSLSDMGAEEYRAWKQKANLFVKNNMPSNFSLSYHDSPTEFPRDISGSLYTHNSPENNWSEYNTGKNPQRTLVLTNNNLRDLTVPKSIDPLQANVSQMGTYPDGVVWNSDSVNPNQWYPEGATGAMVAKTHPSHPLSLARAEIAAKAGTTGFESPTYRAAEIDGQYQDDKADVRDRFQGKKMEDLSPADQSLAKSLIGKRLLGFAAGVGSTLMAYAAPLEPIDQAGLLGDALGFGYGNTAAAAAGGLGAAAYFAPNAAKSIVSGAARISPAVLALQAGTGMSNITKDQMQKAGPRDRSAIAYSQNTGTSIPEARRQYDNMQQGLLSGGATKTVWDQFDPKNYF